MKIHLSPTSGLSLTISSPIFVELLIDEENGIWEKYEAFIQDNTVTNLLFGKNTKFDHFGNLNVRKVDTNEKFAIKFNKSEGLL